MEDRKRIRLARPVIPEAAIAAAAAVLRSGDLVQGENVRLFEAQLAGYLGAHHCAAASSGTAALHLALLAAGIKPGDEVIVPAFTFPATANVVVAAGATPVFADIRLDDCCVDPALVERAITPRTRAVMPVHEFGAAAPVDEIAAIAGRHGIVVIEDAACALGTRIGGRAAGTIGWAGCYSFHPRKILTTGEGGAVVTSDAAAAARLRQLRNHGIASSPGRGDVVAPGLNYRMTEMAAAIGREQLGGIDREIGLRRAQAGVYSRGLAPIGCLATPAGRPGTDHSYQTYHVLLDPAVDRDGLIAHLAERGIETNIGAHALHCLTYYRSAHRYQDSDYSNAFRAYRSGLALPIGSHLADGDLDRVIDEFLRWWRAR